MSESPDPSSPDERRLIDTKPFTVHARIPMQLGRESISSAVTAITELVKNAYDADASSVRIRFHKLGSPDSMLVIEDDGHGMTMDELTNVWLVLGTTNKVKTRKSKQHRVITGEKGLGRLGLDRLCQITTVQAIVKDATSAFELDVDWTKYEGDEVRLDQVKHKLYSISDLRKDPITNTYADYPHGMRLILKRLKEDWDDTSLLALRDELSLLISPFGDKQDFEIELHSGGRSTEFDGPILPPEILLGAATWKVEAAITDDGLVSMRMSSKHHKRVYEEQALPWELRFPGLGRTPHCGPLQLEFYHFPRKPTEFGEQTISRSTIAAFLEKNQGMRIYRDGFRVKPYGSPNGDGDWLRLAFRRMSSPEGVTQDKRPGNWRVGYNQLIGAVFLTREKNVQLLDKTDREGLVVGTAFAHLRAFAEEVITFFELNHQDYEMSRVPRRTPREVAETKAAESIAAAESAISTLTTVAARLADTESKGDVAAPETDAKPVNLILPGVIDEVIQSLNLARADLGELAKASREENECQAQEKDALANLASLGILAAAFAHETLGTASTCAINAGWLERNFGEHIDKYSLFMPPGVAEQTKQKLADTCSQARRIATFAEFSLENVKPGKRRKTIFSLKKVIEIVLKSFKQEFLAHRNIDIDFVVGDPRQSYNVHGYPVDWESVLVNLITNSVWAINENNDERARLRQIKVQLDASDEQLMMKFDDSGIGLVPGSEERIFLPTVSTKRNKQTGELEGTGLGLTIAKNFIEQNSGGNIRAIASAALGGACFVITVPLAKEEA